MLRRPFRFLLRDSHWGFVFKIQIFHVPVSFISTHNLWSYFPEDVPQPAFSIVLNKRGSLFSGGSGLEMKQKCPGLGIGPRLATAADHTQGCGAWKAVAIPWLWGSRTGRTSDVPARSLPVRIQRLKQTKTVLSCVLNMTFVIYWNCSKTHNRNGTLLTVHLRMPSWVAFTHTGVWSPISTHRTLFIL